MRAEVTEMHERETQAGRSGAEAAPRTRVSRRRFLRGASLVGAAALLGTARPPAARAAVPATMLDFLKEAAKPYRGADISFLAHNANTTKDIEPLLGKFTEATGIRVRPTYLGENEVLTKIDLELSSGAGAFDVIWTFSQNIARYGRGQWLEPVEKLIDDPKLTSKELWKPEDFFEGARREMSYQGTLLAAPTFQATQIFYYRKDIFKQHGIGAVPDTLDDLRAVMEKVNRKPVPAIALRTARGSTMNVWNWTAWLYALGGAWFKSYDPKSPDYMRPALDSPAAARAAETYAEVVQKYAPAGATNWGWVEASRSFKARQVAMIQEGSPFGSQFMDPKQSEVADEGLLGTFLVPKGPAGRFSNRAAHGWSISKASRRKEAGWLFITWATSIETWKESTIASPNATVPRKTIWAWDPFLKKYGWGNYLETVRAAMSNSGEYPVYLPSIPEYRDIGDEVSARLQQVIAGQRKADEAMKEANQVVEKIIQRAGYYK
jgi:multiple sugar transport system substrate-binding protein